MDDEMLKKYSKIDQKHIINLGLSAFSYIKNIEISLNNNDSNLIDNLSNENKNLKRKISEIENNNFNNISNLKVSIREETYNEFNVKYEDLNKDNIEFKNKVTKLEKELSKSRQDSRDEMQKNTQNYMNLINDIKKDYNSIDNLIEKSANDKAELATNAIKEQLINTQEELKDIKTKYISYSKGTAYEKIVCDEIVDYNNYLGNIWDIQHIGQTVSHKGDITMCHKDNGKRVMFDCKNHDCVPKDHREKFISDFDNSLPDLAIMISRGNISTKKVYEVTIRNGRKLVYLSNYPTGNPGYLYSIIEKELDMNNLDKNIDIHNYKLHLEENYCEGKKLYDILLKQIEILKNRLTSIKDNYLTTFKTDIDIELSSNKKTKPVQEEKTNITPLEYEKLEARRIMKGNRSQYYLHYDDDKGKPTIQYFRDAASRDKKEKTLANKKEKEIEINTT